MFVGVVHVLTQLAIGWLVEVTDVALPKENVPVSGSVLPPEVKVVADAVMCQPAPLPVASVAVSC